MIPAVKMYQTFKEFQSFPPCLKGVVSYMHGLPLITPEDNIIQSGKEKENYSSHLDVITISHT